MIVRISPPMLGREAKLRHAIALHELRLMSLFPDWIDKYPITYNLPRVKRLLNAQSLEEIERWEPGDWGLWNSLMTKWRSFAKDQAGF